MGIIVKMGKNRSGSPDPDAAVVEQPVELSTEDNINNEPTNYQR